MNFLPSNAQYFYHPFLSYHIGFKKAWLQRKRRKKSRWAKSIATVAPSWSCLLLSQRPLPGSSACFLLLVTKSVRYDSCMINGRSCKNIVSINGDTLYWGTYRDWEDLFCTLLLSLLSAWPRKNTWRSFCQRSEQRLIKTLRYTTEFFSKEKRLPGQGPCHPYLVLWSLLVFLILLLALWYAGRSR